MTPYAVDLNLCCVLASLVEGGGFCAAKDGGSLSLFLSLSQLALTAPSSEGAENMLPEIYIRKDRRPRRSVCAVFAGGASPAPTMLVWVCAIFAHM